MLHCTAEFPCVLENDVTVGHSVTLHGCRVGAYCLVGIGAIVLNEAEIGEESIVAAGTLVPERMKIPPRSLVMGAPAKVRRSVTAEERVTLRGLAEAYVGYKETYLAETGAGTAHTGDRCLHEAQCAEGPCLQAADDPSLWFCAQPCGDCPAGMECSGGQCRWPVPSMDTMPRCAEPFVLGGMGVTTGSGGVLVLAS